ncbi:MAG TPA: hypothetical protein ENG87_00510 [Candidatus Pacearchaeota archaeon]|nr:hypothetical protein BMS3Abin17_00090 [archaeon BMS3Abin17]HDK41830.1 hypothetical protein [Candidatus Pacearchaeota archaeon]HDZ60162.1 hypothetical protein [Candidatus Pacearchaeota archaeon]
MAYIEPFDFKKIFVNYFLGNQELFIFAFTILFSYVAAKYQMSNTIFLSLLVIGSVMFAAYIGEAIYILFLFLTGLIIFRMVASLVA